MGSSIGWGAALGGEQRWARHSTGWGAVLCRVQCWAGHSAGWGAALGGEQHWATQAPHEYFKLEILVTVITIIIIYR